MSSSFFHCQTHKVPGQHIRHYAHSTAHDQHATFYIHVKQYTPLDNLKPEAGDVTIIATHASGVPKEAYEPVWDELLASSRRCASWFDSARDLLAVVNHLRDDMVQPIFGFGHSFGGNVLVQTALLHPRLFSALALADPTLIYDPAQSDFSPVTYIAQRRETWPSRDAARASFSKKSIYALWDPRAFENWITYGLIENDDGSVSLATSASQEVLMYGRASHPAAGEPLSSFCAASGRHSEMKPELEGKLPFYRPEGYLVFNNLPHLQPGVNYIYPLKKTTVVCKPEHQIIRHKITGTGLGGSGGLNAGRVDFHNVDGGHFFPLEKPAETAEIVNEYYAAEVSNFKRLQMENERLWKNRPVEQRSTIDNDYVYFAKNYKQYKPGQRVQAKI
ncbi:hypothetical protein VHEMI09590 [[Torrubiella] hemipterigena]|uniref:Serine aminopeptidase S33 domain-containing protein n=1 Tax=[Torrubiella] hemipterigena TaxID=1531966 RepID=A0A0A1TGP6_9HYPO|nr:hypothetical protein VHEMI09590 [[Torrubiella] hemipterigena]